MIPSAERGQGFIINLNLCLPGVHSSRTSVYSARVQREPESEMLRYLRAHRSDERVASELTRLEVVRSVWAAVHPLSHTHGGCSPDSTS